MGVHRIPFLLALGANAWAAAPGVEPPPPKAQASATVTVTAEATPVEISKTPNPVKVMDQEAIQATGARTLDELLPSLLAGQIQSYGGAGTGTTLYLAGGRAGDVVVVLDGIRVSDPSSLSPSFSDFSLEGIDRVEVLEGPSSTRYGSDTHGGVIAMYSAGPARQGLSGEFRGAAGTRGIAGASAAPAYGWDGGWVRLGASTSREDASIPADLPYRTVSTSLNAGQKVNEDGLVTLSLRDHYRGTPLPFASEYPAPDFAFTPRFVPGRGNSERDRDAIVSYRQILNPAWAFEASFGHVANERVEPAMTLGDPSELYQGQRNQLVGSLTWTPLKGTQVNFLLDGTAESADLHGAQASGSQASVPWDHATATHLAAATELSWEGEGGLRAVVSGRFQKDAIDYLIAKPAPHRVPRRDTDRFVYKAGLNWLSKSGVRLYASYGTSYNTPVLYQLVQNLANEYGDLANETSHGGQVGAGYERGSWLFKVEASRTEYDQVVHYVSMPYPQYRYENGTNLRVQGVEATAAFTGVGWRLEGFARSQEARNMDQPGPSQFSTSGAAGRPFFTSGLRGTATWKDWRVSGRWSYTGSSYQYFDIPGLVLGERTHFNDVSLALTWSPVKSLSWTLRGDHLLQDAWTKEDWLSGRMSGRNDTYLLPVFPVSGRTFTLEVKYRL